MIGILLNHGVNSDARDKIGRTPLFLALETYDDVAMAHILENNGAN